MENTVNKEARGNQTVDHLMEHSRCDMNALAIGEPVTLGENELSVNSVQGPLCQSDYRKLALALNVVTIGLEANFRFLEREFPDIESARALAASLLNRARQLEVLVRRMDRSESHKILGASS